MALWHFGVPFILMQTSGTCDRKVKSTRQLPLMSLNKLANTWKQMVCWKNMTIVNTIYSFDKMHEEKMTCRGLRKSKTFEGNKKQWQTSFHCQEVNPWNENDGNVGQIEIAKDKFYTSVFLITSDQPNSCLYFPSSQCIIKHILQYLEVMSYFYLNTEVP